MRKKPHRNGEIMNIERGIKDIKRAERLLKTIGEAIEEFECAIAPDEWTADRIYALSKLDEAEKLAWTEWLAAQLRLHNMKK
jgi:hypothetical protein